MESISDKITKRLIFGWRNAVDAAKNPKKTSSSPHIFYGSKENSYYLTLDGIRAIRQIINDFKTIPDVTNKFSDDHLEGLIKSSIAKLLSIGEENIVHSAKQQVDEILKALSSQAVEWTIIVPTVNLELEMGNLQIGKVRFHRFTNREELILFENVTKSYVKIQKNSSKLPNELSKDFKSMLLKTVEENFDGKICAEIKVQAVDSIRAQEIGFQKLNLAMDVLRFYKFNRNFVDVNTAKDDFGVQGELTEGRLNLILFSDTGISVPKKLTGYMVPFMLSYECLSDLRSDGLDIVHEILKKDDAHLTSFEKDLITSIRLVASGSRHEQIANAFVNTVIALEALLLDDRESITDNLAERVAFIIGKNATERNVYFDEMKDLYKLRCEIVHSGNTDIKYSDLNLLRRSITYQCIVTLIKSYEHLEIDNIKDLIKWIRDQKFS